MENRIRSGAVGYARAARMIDQYEFHSRSILTRADNLLWKPQLDDVMQSAEYKKRVAPDDFIVGVEKGNFAKLAFDQVPNLLMIGNPVSNKFVVLDTR